MATEQISDPVTASAFGSALDALDPTAPLAVAVSGGADSMALLLMTGRWAHTAGASVYAFTVDHGLRAESAAEARQVAEWCAALGMRHRTLRWKGEKPESCIQAAARTARYELLATACSEVGAPCLLIGHHMEDQAETLLMRLARGSGVDGLTAMRPETVYRGIRVLRPLLGFSNASLRATLAEAAQNWIEDPSNRDQKYTRIRVRKMLQAMAADGMPVRRLADTAQRMGRARAALEHFTDELLGTIAVVEPAGFARVARAGLAEAPEEIGLRALARLVTTIGGKLYTPRMRPLEHLYEWACSSISGGGRTLSGCCIIPDDSQIVILRETVAVGPDLPLLPGESGVWDARFLVDIDAETGLTADDAATLVVRALGRDGLRQIKQLSPDLHTPDIPAAALRVLPGLWLGDSLIAAPHLDFHHPAHPQVKDRFSARFAPARDLLPINTAEGAV